MSEQNTKIKVSAEFRDVKNLSKEIKALEESLGGVQQVIKRIASGLAEAFNSEPVKKFTAEQRKLNAEMKKAAEERNRSDRNIAAIEREARRDETYGKYQTRVAKGRKRYNAKHIDPNMRAIRAEQIEDARHAERLKRQEDRTKAERDLKAATEKERAYALREKQRQQAKEQRDAARKAAKTQATRAKAQQEYSQATELENARAVRSRKAAEESLLEKRARLQADYTNASEAENAQAVRRRLAAEERAEIKRAARDAKQAAGLQRAQDKRESQFQGSVAQAIYGNTRRGRVMMRAANIARIRQAKAGGAGAGLRAAVAGSPGGGAGLARAGLRGLAGNLLAGGGTGGRIAGGLLAGFGGGGGGGGILGGGVAGIALAGGAALYGIGNRRVQAADQYFDAAMDLREQASRFSMLSGGATPLDRLIPLKNEYGATYKWTHRRGPLTRNGPEAAREALKRVIATGAGMGISGKDSMAQLFGASAAMNMTPLAVSNSGTLTSRILQGKRAGLSAGTSGLLAQRGNPMRRLAQAEAMGLTGENALGFLEQIGGRLAEGKLTGLGTSTRGIMGGSAGFQGLGANATQGAAMSLGLARGFQRMFGSGPQSGGQLLALKHLGGLNLNGGRGIKGGDVFRTMADLSQGNFEKGGLTSYASEILRQVGGDTNIAGAALYKQLTSMGVNIAPNMAISMAEAAARGGGSAIESQIRDQIKAAKGDAGRAARSTDDAIIRREQAAAAGLQGGDARVESRILWEEIRGDVSAQFEYFKGAVEIFGNIVNAFEHALAPSGILMSSE